MDISADKSGSTLNYEWNNLIWSSSDSAPTLDSNGIIFTADEVLQYSQEYSHHLDCNKNFTLYVKYTPQNHTGSAAGFLY